MVGHIPIESDAQAISKIGLSAVISQEVSDLLL